MFGEQFYPTPPELAEKMVEKVNWKGVERLLEPSAGKGDLIRAAEEYVRAGHRKKFGWELEWSLKHVDVLECDRNLQHILKGEHYNLVGEDFLSYFTMLRYDVILMNPPFENGDEHLLKAISLMEDYGGQIVCLLNAETLRNPYTSRRKVLATKLARFEADIEYVEDAFKNAERTTDVVCAIVYLNIPRPIRSSALLGELKAAQKADARLEDVTELVAGDWKQQLIIAFNNEAKLGVAFLEEFSAISPYIRSGVSENAAPLILLSIRGDAVTTVTNETVEAYLRNLREKYWEALFKRDELTSRMTRAMQSDYLLKVRELRDYDFSAFNIDQIIREISVQLADGVEQSIEDLFDKLSVEHAWYPECKDNIHYYNGWKTNKAHMVGMKVILPLNGFALNYYSGKKKVEARNFAEALADIERALNYLDRGETESDIDPFEVSREAEKLEQTKMDFKYFSATFYKKGTCHLKFHEDAAILIDRLNIFAGRSKQWLPPDYGKKRYDSMDDESKAVIDSFQGKDSYEKVMAAPQNYIVAPANEIKLLSA